ENIPRKAVLRSRPAATTGSPSDPRDGPTRTEPTKYGRPAPGEAAQSIELSAAGPDAQVGSGLAGQGNHLRGKHFPIGDVIPDFQTNLVGLALGESRLPGVGPTDLALACSFFNPHTRLLESDGAGPESPLVVEGPKGHLPCRRVDAGKSRAGI